MFVIILLSLHWHLCAFLDGMRNGKPEWCVELSWEKPREFWMRDTLSVKDFLKQLDVLYTKNINAPIKNQDQWIPRKIHQIWLGSVPPARYQKMARTWQKLFPTWEYKLWTDEDIEKFGLYNKKLYDKATNFGEKSDIARYEILLREGGLYADFDTVCFKPEFFENAHKRYDFYTGADDNALYTMVANYLIGSIPQHPILKKIVTEMSSWQQLQHDLRVTDWLNTHSYQKHSSTSSYIKKCIDDWISIVNHWNEVGARQFLPTVLMTGPGLFSHIIITYEQQNPETVDIVFPADVFAKPCPDETVPALHIYGTSWLSEENSPIKTQSVSLPYIKEILETCRFNLSDHLINFERAYPKTE